MLFSSSYPLIIQEQITTYICLCHYYNISTGATSSLLIIASKDSKDFPFSGLLAIDQSSKTESNTVFFLHIYYLENWNAKILAKSLLLCSFSPLTCILQHDSCCILVVGIQKYSILYSMVHDVRGNM